MKADWTAWDSRKTRALVGRNTRYGFLILTLLKDFPGCRVCGHRDLSPDLDGDGEIEPEEWIKACPCFEASKEWDKE